MYICIYIHTPYIKRLASTHTAPPNTTSQPDPRYLMLPITLNHLSLFYLPNYCSSIVCIPTHLHTSSHTSYITYCLHTLYYKLHITRLRYMILLLTQTYTNYLHTTFAYIFVYHVCSLRSHMLYLHTPYDTFSIPTYTKTIHIDNQYTTYIYIYTNYWHILLFLYTDCILRITPPHPWFCFAWNPMRAFGMRYRGYISICRMSCHVTATSRSTDSWPPLFLFALLFQVIVQCEAGEARGHKSQRPDAAGIAAKQISKCAASLVSFVSAQNEILISHLARMRFETENIFKSQYGDNMWQYV